LADCRNCQHIQLAQQYAESLDLNGAFATTFDQAEMLIASRNVDTKAVSHLPISPPEWCRLPKDKDLPRVFFRGGKNLPPVFLYDHTSRCSCGETLSLQAITITTLTIFTSIHAIERQIETRYCTKCTNTRGRIGPDLGKHGVFNWNNKIAFSHELMNSYTSHFTTSETPIYSFHQTVMNAYLNDDSSPFCSIQTFLSAWFAFARLQVLESDMECIQCGPSPQIVIADGISVAFAKRRLEGLRPPTCSDMPAHVKLPKTNLKATCFTGSAKVRKTLQRALDDKNVDEGKAKILGIIADQVISSVAVIRFEVFSIHNSEAASPRYSLVLI
jgi:hypothetical protein